MSKQEWAQKEKRELFCKFVNSRMMSKPDSNLRDVIQEASEVVGRAFENYPDKAEESKEDTNDTKDKVIPF